MTDTVARHACRTCGGTGKTWSLRSWFTDDGYRSSTCGICGGIGLSTYRDAPEYIRFQANARAARGE